MVAAHSERMPVNQRRSLYHSSLHVFMTIIIVPFFPALAFGARILIEMTVKVHQVDLIVGCLVC